jgi:hypothetical protein
MSLLRAHPLWCHCCARFLWRHARTTANNIHSHTYPCNTTTQLSDWQHINYDSYGPHTRQTQNSMYYNSKMGNWPLLFFGGPFFGGALFATPFFEFCARGNFPCADHGCPFTIFNILTVLGNYMDNHTTWPDYFRSEFVRLYFNFVRNKFRARTAFTCLSLLSRISVGREHPAV